MGLIIKLINFCITKAEYFLKYFQTTLQFLDTIRVIIQFLLQRKRQLEPLC